MSRTKTEVLNRLQVTLADARHWESRVAEFGENTSRDKMIITRGKLEELTWMLEAFEG